LEKLYNDIGYSSIWSKDWRRLETSWAKKLLLLEFFRKMGKYGIRYYSIIVQFLQEKSLSNYGINTHQLKENNEFICWKEY
jgi:hypothetical protein